ncbi:hypothetical protein BH10BAC4_BH10BAC4_21110 [soil metagenome]
MKPFLLVAIMLSTFTLIAQRPPLGIAADFDKDSLVTAAGYKYLVSSIGKYISPRNVSDKQFKENLKAAKKLKVKLLAFNLFFHGDQKLVGPMVDEKALMDYTKAIFARCKAIGVKMIVWGSGGARRVPEGFDQAKATEQFTSLAGSLAVEAAKYNITIVIESLNSSETNFLNTLEEVYEVVKKVDHPNLKMNADFYHMMRENESPDIIIKAAKYIAQCEIAEKEKRTPPGTIGDDFRPYLKALKDIKYKGAIVLECNFQDLTVQAKPGYDALQKQMDDVWGKK